MANRQAKTFASLGLLVAAGCGAANPDAPSEATAEPSYVYVANYYSHDVSGYRLDDRSRALTPVPGSPFAAGVNPAAVTTTPSGRTVLVTNSGSRDIWSYNRQPDGSLVPAPGAPFSIGGGTPTITVEPSGRFAYAGSYLSRNVSGFAIDPSNSALTPLPGSPFPGRNLPLDRTGCFNSPNVLTPSVDGRFLYAAGSLGGGCVAVYAIDPTSGSLAHIPGSPFALLTDPRAVAVDPSGRFLAVSSWNFSGRFPQIETYPLDAATGVPGPTTGSAPGGLVNEALAFAPSGRFLYVASSTRYPDFTGAIGAYRLDPASGALAPVEGSPYPTGRRPEGIVVDPSGRFLFVTNYLASAVAVYSLDPNSGVPTPVPDSPFATGDTPVGVAVTKPGRAQ